MTRARRMGVRIAIVLLGAAAISAIRKEAPAPEKALEVVSGESRFDVVAVDSMDHPIYDEVIHGFEEHVHGRVKVFTLGENRQLSEDDWQRASALRPALFLAVGEPALRELDRRTPAAPIIFTALGKHPGKTSAVAGVFMAVTMDRQLDTLLSINPHRRRIGAVAKNTSSVFFDELEHAAKKRQMEVTVRRADDPEDAVAAMEDLFARIDAYVLVPDTGIHSKLVLNAAYRLSEKHRVPVIGFRRDQCANGALISAQMDPKELGAETGRLTQQYLFHGKPPEEPFRALAEHWQYVDTKMAKRLAMTIPDEVLASSEDCTEAE